MDFVNKIIIISLFISRTEEEDQIIIAYQKLWGNQWAKITSQLPGRTDNAVKNRFHTTIRNRTKKGSFSSNSALPLSLLVSSQCVFPVQFNNDYNYSEDENHNYQNNLNDSLQIALPMDYETMDMDKDSLPISIEIENYQRQQFQPSSPISESIGSISIDMDDDYCADTLDIDFSQLNWMEDDLDDEDDNDNNNPYAYDYNETKKEKDKSNCLANTKLFCSNTCSTALESSIQQSKQWFTGFASKLCETDDME